MTTGQNRRYEMLVRVRSFGDTHREAFPEHTVGGHAFAAIAAAVTQMSEFYRSKVTTSRESRSTKALARAALADRINTIARTAKVIAGSVPGFDDPFTLGRGRQSDRTLLVNGELFGAAADAVQAQFLAHGLPATFVADLSACVTQFTQAVQGREAGKSGATAAQAGIDAALASALTALRTLDVIVVNQLGADPVAMAVWKRERRTTPAKARPAVSPAPAPQTVNTPDTPVNPSPV